MKVPDLLPLAFLPQVQQLRQQPLSTTWTARREAQASKGHQLSCTYRCSEADHKHHVAAQDAERCARTGNINCHHYFSNNGGTKLSSCALLTVQVSMRILTVQSKILEAERSPSACKPHQVHDGSPCILKILPTTACSPLTFPQ